MPMPKDRSQYEIETLEQMVLMSASGTDVDIEGDLECPEEIHADVTANEDVESDESPPIDGEGPLEEEVVDLGQVEGEQAGAEESVSDDVTEEAFVEDGQPVEDSGEPPSDGESPGDEETAGETGPSAETGVVEDGELLPPGDVILFDGEEGSETEVVEFAPEESSEEESDISDDELLEVLPIDTPVDESAQSGFGGETERFAEEGTEASPGEGEDTGAEEGSEDVPADDDLADELPIDTAVDESAQSGASDGTEDSVEEVAEGSPDEGEDTGGEEGSEEGSANGESTDELPIDTAADESAQSGASDGTEDSVEEFAEETSGEGEGADVEETNEEDSANGDTTDALPTDTTADESAQSGATEDAAPITTNGSDDAEWIAGADGDNIINAGGGNDEIYVPFGNNVIDGGEGDDALIVYEGDSSDYDVVLVSDGTVVVEGPGLNGETVTHQLRNVERIVFNDRVVYVSDVGGPTEPTAPTVNGTDDGEWITVSERGGDVNAGGGDDFIYAPFSFGFNEIDGGEGDDTLVVYEGSRADYIIQRSEDGSTTLVEGPGLNGATVINLLTDVEMILFNDEAVVTADVTEILTRSFARGG